MRLPFIYDRYISKMEDYNAHYFKELRIRNEERPFLMQERPLLVSRGACSRTLKGIFRNLEWPPLYLRTMKTAYKHSLLNPPKHPCLVHNPTPNCPYILPVSSPNPLRLVYEIMVYHPQPNLFRPQTHSAPSTSSSCIIHETHGISSTTPSCALFKHFLHCLRPNVLYSFAQGLLLHNKKKKKQKTTVFYFFFFISIFRPTPLMRDYP